MYSFREGASSESECDIIRTVRETVNAELEDNKPNYTHIEIHKHTAAFQVDHGATINTVPLRAKPGGEGMKPNPGNVDAILNLQRLTSV